MRRIVLVLAAAGALGGAAAALVPASGETDGVGAPIYGIKIPPGYRDWQLISVAREDGNFNQLRAQLGNDIAVRAYREGKLPFPDGSIIVALHWDDVASEEDNKVFGRAADEAMHKTCFPCHEPANARDFVFTRYAP